MIYILLITGITLLIISGLVVVVRMLIRSLHEED